MPDANEPSLADWRCLYAYSPSAPPAARMLYEEVRQEIAFGAG